MALCANECGEGIGFATLTPRNPFVIYSLHSQITESRMDSPSPFGRGGKGVRSERLSSNGNSRLPVKIL